MGSGILLFVLFAGIAQAGGPVDLTGAPKDPFHSPAHARVFLFVRTDCPLTNRYAPELQRIAGEFAGQGVDLWLVYPDPSETSAGIEKHIAEYRFPGTPVRDPQHVLVARAHATVSPEAAVFDSGGHLEYLGRIDDRFVELGKSRPAPRTHDLEAAIAAVLHGQTVSPAKTRAVGCFLADVE